MGTDFIGLLQRTRARNTHTLNVVCCFSRFEILFATKNANVKEIILCLRQAFITDRKPYAIYCDRGQHFFNDELRGYLRLERVARNYSPWASSKSTRMEEASNRLLEEILQKSHNSMDWDQRIPKAATSLKSRIIAHLGVSSTGILFGPIQETSTSTATLLALPGRDIRSWVEEIEDPVHHAHAVKTYLTYRVDLHDSIKQHSATRSTEARLGIMYNRGVRQVTHGIGGLVMFHQRNARKLLAGTALERAVPDI